MGPTASGKSALALRLAKQHRGLIINADSMQIYRELPILTAQPTIDQLAECTHVLYGKLNANEICSAGLYLKLVNYEIAQAFSQQLTPIIVGGTGLYLKSLIEGIAEIPEIDQNIKLDVEAEYKDIGIKELYLKLQQLDEPVAKRLNPSDIQRIIRAYLVIKQTGKSISYWQQQPKQIFYDKRQFVLISLCPERQQLYLNCDERFIAMLNLDVLTEVANFIKTCPDKNWPLVKALGVAPLKDFLEKKISLEQAICLSQQQTRNYAKRQLTWFRHQMKDAHCLKYSNLTEIYDQAEDLCKGL